MALELSVNTLGDVTVLSFSGSLNTQSSPDAQSKFTDLINDGAKKIVANFERLDFITSAGLRILLFALKELNKVDGELRICSPNEIIKEVFDYSDFATIVSVSDSESEALESF